MRALSTLRASLIALLALAGAALAPAAYADSGSISFSVVKAGFVVGGSGGRRKATVPRQDYTVSIGGLSYGFTFGASETRFHGTVSNINSPYRRRRRLCRGQRRRGDWRRRPGHRAHQPEGRGAHAHRPLGRPHRQRRSQRAGDHGEVGELSGIEHREIRDMQRSLPRISFYSVRFCCSLCLTFIGGTID